MSNEQYAYVKCCEKNKQYIFITFENNLFNLDNGNGVIPDYIEYCPWCGILLDINIVEKYEERHDLSISNDDLIRAWNYGDNSYNKGKA